MKLYFDANQEYQIEGIKAITNVFKRQPLRGGDFEFSLQSPRALHSLLGVGNRLNIQEDELEHNVKAIQETNNIIPTKLFLMQECIFQLKWKPEQIRLMCTCALFTNCFNYMGSLNLLLWSHQFPSEKAY